MSAQNDAWRPIEEADNGIAYAHAFGEIRIGNSYPIWARDKDGRIFEALWSDNGKLAYWWDIEGESPVDPVDFMPHPLDPRFSKSTVNPTKPDFSVRNSDFGQYILITMPTGCDCIVAFADKPQHTPVWLGLPHQMYVRTFAELLNQHQAESLTIVPYRNSSKVNLTKEDVAAATAELANAPVKKGATDND